MVDINPFKQSSLSGPFTTIGYFYLLLKIFVTTYTTIDYDVSGGKVFVILVTIYCILFLILRY
jgi:hypothetical protein